MTRLPPGPPAEPHALLVTEPRLPGLVAALVAGLFALAGTGFLVGSVLTGGRALAVLVTAAAVVAALGGVAVRGAWRMLAPRVYFEAGPRGVVVHDLGARRAALPGSGPLPLPEPGVLVPWADVAEVQPATVALPAGGWLTGDDGPRRLVRLALRAGGDVYLPAFGEPGGEALLETLRDLHAGDPH